MLGLAALPVLSAVYATSDLSSLGSPDITISPTSGPPGTEITIMVTNIPDVSKETYPYPDLYIYLPFSQSFGTTPQSQCGASDCFPIYTHDEAMNHDFADRNVTFALFSTLNPNSVYLNGYENTPCDVVVNGKTVERYSTLCNTKDQPPGTYNIQFAWVEENAPQIKYVVKTVQFTVTTGQALQPPQKVDNGNSIIVAYQNGAISESEFYSKLSAMGWSSEEIRQALATIGKLPHQMGAPVPDEMQQIQAGVQKAALQSSPQISQQAQQPQTPPPPAVQNSQPVSEVQTADSLAPYKTEPVQHSSQPVPAQPAQGSALQNNFWTLVTIIASVGAASAVGGSILVARQTRKVTN